MWLVGYFAHQCVLMWLTVNGLAITLLCNFPWSHAYSVCKL